MSNSKPEKAIKTHPREKFQPVIVSEQSKLDAAQKLEKARLNLLANNPNLIFPAAGSPVVYYEPNELWTKNAIRDLTHPRVLEDKTKDKSIIDGSHVSRHRPIKYTPGSRVNFNKTKFCSHTEVIEKSKDNLNLALS